jgi:hypothetical protein
VPVGVEVIVTLTLSVATALAAAIYKLLQGYATEIRLLTKLSEDVRICLVGIEALRMIDTEANRRMDDAERRLDDVERYLETSSAALANEGTYKHPFRLRGKGTGESRP